MRKLILRNCGENDVVRFVTTPRPKPRAVQEEPPMPSELPTLAESTLAKLPKLPKSSKSSKRSDRAADAEGIFDRLEIKRVASLLRGIQKKLYPCAVQEEPPEPPPPVEEIPMLDGESQRRLETLEAMLGDEGLALMPSEEEEAINECRRILTVARERQGEIRYHGYNGQKTVTLNLDRLRQSMESRGMSQKELAKAARIHNVTLTRLFDGKRLVLASAEKVAAALGVEIEYLRGGVIEQDFDAEPDPLRYNRVMIEFDYERFMQVMKARGLTVKELAAMTQRTPCAIYDLFRRRSCSLQKCVSLACVLSVDATEFIARTLESEAAADVK